MAYRNLFLRMLFSIMIIFVYLATLYINFEYIYYLIIFLYLIVNLEVLFIFKKITLPIILYILVSFLFCISLDYNYENIIKFNLFIITIITFDIFSYFFGKLYGKNKIFKKISPNKTYEGLIGGISSALFISLAYLYFFGIAININSIFIIIIIIVSSFLGDIIESYFKRVNNLKNSSNLLPGHGGFFDRFDSFIFAIIPYSFTQSLL